VENSSLYSLEWGGSDKTNCLCLSRLKQASCYAVCHTAVSGVVTGLVVNVLRELEFFRHRLTSVLGVDMQQSFVV